MRKISNCAFCHEPIDVIVRSDRPISDKSENSFHPDCFTYVRDISQGIKIIDRLIHNMDLFINDHPGYKFEPLYSI